MLYLNKDTFYYRSQGRKISFNRKMLDISNIGSALNRAYWAVNGLLQKLLFHCDLTSDTNSKQYKSTKQVFRIAIVPNYLNKVPYRT